MGVWGFWVLVKIKQIFMYISGNSGWKFEFSELVEYEDDEL